MTNEGLEKTHRLITADAAMWFLLMWAHHTGPLPAKASWANQDTAQLGPPARDNSIANLALLVTMGHGH
jgi:hypothetical protein